MRNGKPEKILGELSSILAKRKSNYQKICRKASVFWRESMPKKDNPGRIVKTLWRIRTLGKPSNKYSGRRIQVPGPYKCLGQNVLIHKHRSRCQNLIHWGIIFAKHKGPELSNGCKLKCKCWQNGHLKGPLPVSQKMERNSVRRKKVVF